jgi:enoyl-CoA hydratase
MSGQQVDVLLSGCSEGVLTLTLNRPQSRNALSAQLRSALTTAVAEANEDSTVGVIILTGTDPAFCAGVDLHELRDASVDPSTIGPRQSPFLTSVKPLIGAINGPAYTGGLELALACHILIASDRATFADTHARFGLTPGWGLTVLLTEAVGPRRAREMALTGQPISAQTALDTGLVSAVIPHEQLLDRARDLAVSCATSDRTAVAALGRIFNEQAQSRQEKQWAIETDNFRGARVGSNNA